MERGYEWRGGGESMNKIRKKRSSSELQGSGEI